VEKADSIALSSRPIPMRLILMVALAVHVPLLLIKLPLRSYDTNLHIFFASHYVHHWFDPWNQRWYAGFSQTTYPPLPQMWVAVFSHVLGLDYAYMLVQFISICLLVIGVYRFSKLWVDPRSASYAALAAIFLGSENFLVYSAGQLATTSAAPIYLNGLPFLFEYVRFGKGKAFIKAVVVFAAAAAAHHATLLFGAFFFAFPVLALALIDREHGERVKTSAWITRTLIIGVVVGECLIDVLLPFWIALIKYPVTQVTIPHPSRANYLLSPIWGVNYFLGPYGAMLFAIPFIFIRGASVVRLRPLLIGYWVAMLVGMGGTTPVARILLGRAFEVLTMERFTYWGTLLALPFVGMLIKILLDRWKGRAAIALAIAAALTSGAGVGWSSYLSGDARDVDVRSSADWLNRDGHDQYRYLTLGFGNEIARLGVLSDANSVDGEWNSGRMLPELTEHGSGLVTSAKFFGEEGMETLRALLLHADHYGMKWVLVRDHYYDPLLVFAGWRPVDSLDDKTIIVWGKDGVPPAVPLNAPQIPPHWQGVMWGIFPFGSGLLAIAVLILLRDKKRDEDEMGRTIDVESDENVLQGRLVS
jgi:hypothetical protein